LTIEIRRVRARKVYNSRGEETVEVEVWAGEGYGRAAAPAGKSKGGKEVAYYPAGGVDESIRLINNELSKKLIGLDASDQEAVDELLRKFDGTEDLKRGLRNLASDGHGRGRGLGETPIRAP